MLQNGNAKDVVNNVILAKLLSGYVEPKPVKKCCSAKQVKKREKAKKRTVSKTSKRKSVVRVSRKSKRKRKTK